MNSNLYKINEVTQHKYYQVPKELYTNPRYKTTINNYAKMLYALLLDRMERREQTAGLKMTELYF